MCENLRSYCGGDTIEDPMVDASDAYVFTTFNRYLIGKVTVLVPEFLILFHNLLLHIIYLIRTL